VSEASAFAPIQAEVLRSRLEELVYSVLSFQRDVGRPAPPRVLRSAPPSRGLAAPTAAR